MSSSSQLEVSTRSAQDNPFEFTSAVPSPQGAADRLPRLRNPVRTKRQQYSTMVFQVQAGAESQRIIETIIGVISSL